MSKSAESGFTLIELVMVLVVIGILSVTAAGMFASRGDFASTLVKDQLLDKLRLTQQISLARQTGNLSLVIDESAGQWRLRVLDSAAADSILLSQTMDQNGTSIHTSNSNFSASCASLPSVAGASPLTLNFDRRGNLNPASANRRICVTGGNTYELCVSSAGYAYEGSCVP